MNYIYPCAIGNKGLYLNLHGLLPTEFDGNFMDKLMSESKKEKDENNQEKSKEDKVRLKMNGERTLK